MTSPVPGAPPARVLAAIAVVLGLMLGSTLVLYALTDPATRPDLLTRLGTVLPYAVTAVPGILGWLSGRQAATSAQEAATNTNGRMSELHAMLERQSTEIRALHERLESRE
ncbi:MAG: hypothetical protein ACRCZP_16750 [Phycicoccus sp.]